MSLLKKKTAPAAESAPAREPLVTASSAEANVIAQQREKTNAYQKDQRQRHMDSWKEGKAHVDGLSEVADVLAYIDQTTDDSNMQRVGLHSMKVNSHEHAIIKAAMKLDGARSSRELFIKLCKEVIKNSK
ncbi:hypothetical protein A1OW_20320 [Enterovibrio norvegicus]|uniref:hypothetical protein n=1 Tax=Enterovibrio norvegicus TaxID=188144 RepID=UPI0003085EBC|nr:hypothetical protein [Enterovibrio norvegicus]OEF61219.1 hypothetical protein A1OW_20320 [Enterovibrio norvegicus]